MEQTPTEIYKSIVYVLSRGSGSKAIFSKVGSTRVSSKSRAKNYTDGEWTVFFELEVAGPLRFHIERTAHEILTAEGYWVDPAMVAGSGGSAKEIFACPPVHAQKAVQSAFSATMIQMMEYIKSHPNLKAIEDKETVKNEKSKAESGSDFSLIENPLHKTIRHKDAEISYMKELISDYKNRIQILENNLSDCKMRIDRLSG